jgi:hypothetical protein
MKEYMNRRYKERRALALELLGGKCVKCESTEKLEFDHINRSQKSMTFERMVGVSMERFMAELIKGQLLCSPCHKLKTIEDFGFKVAKGTHGTISAYTYCRCRLCRDAMNEWIRDYRREKRRKEKGR